MPFGHRSETAPIPQDIREWRAQQPGSAKVDTIRNPLIEPLWEGVHVLAHVTDGAAVLRDEDAIDCTEEFADLAERIGEAARAATLIVDGVLTSQAGLDAPASNAFPQPAKSTQIARRMIVGERAADRRPKPQPRDPDAPIRFIALDLLEIDGDTLLDVPLLERKRLLEAALEPNDLVAVTPFAQPPGDAFRASCRAHGFWAVVYKGQNSRYLPGQVSREWTVHRLPPR